MQHLAPQRAVRPSGVFVCVTRSALARRDQEALRPLRAAWRVPDTIRGRLAMDSASSANKPKRSAAASRDKHRQIEKAHRDRMRTLMQDLARHIYNGNRTEEELSNMTRGDILMAAKECITQLRRKLGEARAAMGPVAQEQVSVQAAPARFIQQVDERGMAMAVQQKMQPGPPADARRTAVAALTGDGFPSLPSSSNVTPRNGVRPSGFPQVITGPGMAGPDGGSHASSQHHTSIAGSINPGLQGPVAGWTNPPPADGSVREPSQMPPAPAGPLSVWSASESYWQPAAAVQWTPMAAMQNWNQNPQNPGQFQPGHPQAPPVQYHMPQQQSQGAIPTMSMSNPMQPHPQQQQQQQQQQHAQQPMHMSHQQMFQPQGGPMPGASASMQQQAQQQQQQAQQQQQMWAQQQQQQPQIVPMPHGTGSFNSTPASTPSAGQSGNIQPTGAVANPAGTQQQSGQPHHAAAATSQPMGGSVRGLEQPGAAPPAKRPRGFPSYPA